MYHQFKDRESPGNLLPGRTDSLLGYWDGSGLSPAMCLQACLALIPMSPPGKAFRHLPCLRQSIKLKSYLLSGLICSYICWMQDGLKCYFCLVSVGVPYKHLLPLLCLLCVCVCVCVRACVGACVRAGGRAGGRACVRACVRVGLACGLACMRACAIIKHPVCLVCHVHPNREQLMSLVKKKASGLQLVSPPLPFQGSTESRS